MEAAKPTAMHLALDFLAAENRLLRIYTQNIDGIEEKCPNLTLQIPLPTTGPWPNTIQMHGTIHVTQCMKCSYRSRTNASIFVGDRPPPCLQCEIPRLDSRGEAKRLWNPGPLRPRVTFYDQNGGWDSEGVAKVVKSDLKARPDAFLVAGTALSTKGALALAKDMCQTVHKKKNGTTIWISKQRPRKELQDLFDVIVIGTCDQLAQYIKL
jgi:NAD-dependent histone deacetylase SIR2